MEQTPPTLGPFPGSPWGGRMPYDWSRPAQYALALAVVALSLVVRGLLDRLLGVEVQFSLTLAALLPLALLVRPGPFLAAAAVGWAGVALLVLPPPMGLAVQEAPLSILYGVLFGLVGWTAWLSRRAIDARERDREDLRQAQRELRHRNEQLRTLVDRAPVGVYVVDEDFRIVQVNPVAMEALEDFEGGVLGRDLDEICRIAWPPRTAEALVRRFRHTLETGAPFSMPEAEVVRADRGRTEHYEWRLERIVVPGGGLGVVCYFRDISEQVGARRRIADSETRLRVATDAAGLGLHVYDVASGTVEWDERVRALWGIDPDEPITYELWRDSLHPEDREAAEAAVQRSLDPAGDHQYISEYRVTHRKDGITRWIEATGQMTFVDGEADRLIGTAQDITARKRTEESLRAQQRSLKDADRRKDEFLAMLAHELRNPLAAIRLALDVMRRPKGADRAGAMQEIIERQSALLVRLIDDLLDVSRITRGKIDLRRAPCDLRSVVEEAVDGVRNACESKGLHLSVARSESPLVVDADALRLAQVIGNLLNNACKFTEAGGEITVTVAREGEEAVARVRDTGVGIPPRDLPRVFEMFTQVQSAKGPQGGGLGLGLPLAKALVELHQGALEAQSAGPGRGSEFVVRLPALSGALATEAEAGEEAGAVTAGARILTVDDNADTLEALSAALRLTGHAVETARDGPEALEKARSQQPEVVLLDIGMPGMSGYEVARRIRSAPWGRAMILIAVTGWGQERDQRAAREAGFDTHLTKPVEVEELSRVLGAHRGEEEVSS